MTPATAVSVLTRWAALEDLLAALARGGSCVEATGLWGGARGLALAAIVLATRRPILALAVSPAERNALSRDAQFFLDALGGREAGAAILEFPSADAASARSGRHREADAERAQTCRSLLDEQPVVVVASPSALGLPVLAPAEFVDRLGALAVGQTREREALVSLLQAAGYEREESVVEVGQWSLRGGIVDIYSPAHTRPVRVEFAGDEVESLRLFDPTTQRSEGAIDTLEILPLPGKGIEPATLADYLPARTLVALGDPRAAEAPPDDAPAAGPLAQLLAGLQVLEMPLVGRRGEAVDLGTRSVGGVRGQWKALASDIHRWREEGFTVRLVADDERQADRVRQMLQDHELPAWPGASLWSTEGIGVLVGSCSTGFVLPALGLVVLTEEEVFGAQRRRLKRPRYERGAALAAFTDLRPNDLVVHEDHGIARYHGLRTLRTDGRDADFLLLEYGEGGRLYVPVERLDLISKYLGAPEGAARLDRLGGSSWLRVKESVRAALREMAEQLLKLYATRSVAERPSFTSDAPWQQEFDAAFRFEETPDQLRAIADVASDMTGGRPMDRLVAGDVGYGKTEVALRAAFTAVAGGRQVAVLVPTTVLAQQHWNTFSERFGPFPVRVELLSRFRTPKEQKAVIEGLARGTVDVVVGTHRLLAKDVTVKNLGLLVIDEEHRFGVAQKEKIKQLRASVDVLTLTATPIPRTLYMAMSGVRDLSLIETAPLDRLPVETVVAPFGRELIREAIERELARGGQVFFVHNRVQSLASMTAFVRSLVPAARIAMAHGQMGERELEAVMVKFVDGQIDVLVSTAIIESGLDIPASNTIIVNRADRFGLAQLYQLRGRVGRERQQAYAYLLVPADGRLDETAQRRLRVIEEMTELGAGFRLAMRDLEIRGAGNLLGAAQHGHIAAVGFDLYSKLLAEAVRELKGEAGAPEVEPVISLGVEAFLPESYVSEVNQRLAFYKRLAETSSEAELADIRGELVDRYGPLPPAVEALLDVVALRAQAQRLRVERLEAGSGRLLVTFAPSTTVTPERLLAVIAKSRGGVVLKREYAIEARLPAGGGWPAVRDAVRTLLGALA
jgi:transcription-repair coupling factor (superfamily II helicase)